jgi:hypothetical protein
VKFVMGGGSIEDVGMLCMGASYEIKTTLQPRAMGDQTEPWIITRERMTSVGSRIRDRAKAGPGLMRKIADLTIFNQSKGKIGSYDHAARVGIEDPTIFNQSKGKSGYYVHAARVGMQNHSKGKSLLHLTSLK